MPSNRNATDAVRSLCDADVEPCARALASAFANDPVYRYIHPGDREWERVGPRFFRILLRYFASHATVLTPETGRAVAIWTPPEPRPPGGIARLRFTMRISALLGRRIARGARVGSALETLHLDEPHWYLAILGTEPSAQGRGLASSLMAPILTRCDAARLPAHVETATDANLAFYASRGFVVIGESRVAGGGPRLWGLRREPLPVRAGFPSALGGASSG
jgi:GNAT superfamily N-acetyltransferase